ncbi:MAG: T9SS type A sorting domain-containing protein [Cyclobacteriaceae bacterium]|nr:T9SS type A sorting domain-containing protein [Cyclobacteriaceae bacterium]
MNRYLLVGIIVYCGLILLAVNHYPTQPRVSVLLEDGDVKDEDEDEDEQDGPGQFIAYHKAIRTPEDAPAPEYKNGFIMRELTLAKSFAARKRNGRTQSNGVVEWKERGPANVPGRTRGLIVDPDDASKNTWYAGSAGGGVWKTTNGGQAWTLLTPNLPNLATTTLAMAESNRNIIYMGTGESFGGLPGIRGSGMFKSTDRGQTWQHLPATASLSDINRIVISPTNANVVVIATALGIFKTNDGGISWSHQLALSGMEDLRVSPANFNIQYAARNSVGVYKSTDAGVTWRLSNAGMSPNGRIELAISPVNPNRIFASAEGTLNGAASDLYVSDNAGATWALINTTFNGTSLNFLGGQGWYDNTIMCDPFNADVIYYGGVSLFRTTLGTGSTAITNYNLEEQNTGFLSLVNFGAGFANGRLEVGPAANASVEIRFGAGRSQMAHRFLVPEGATSGVPNASYSYQNYVSVPFEVWDITNNRQLMVSFRDLDRNGEFNLLLSNTDGAAAVQSREYIYISNVEYNAATPAANIAVNGGHIFQQMYFFWPVLAAGNTWPGSITTSKLVINFTSIPKLNATTITVADAYNQFDGKNRFNTFGVDVHPDHHNLIPIVMSGNTYKILNASDGGLFISNASATPGINNADWLMVGNTYNTSQFYGADKKPGSNEYFGGMQDNGTWRSPAGQQASRTSNYQFSIGGDGFEVVWHKLDPLKLIGGSQGNNFRKSVNGGLTWTVATSGLSGTHPFVSKLATSSDVPDVLYTLSSAGVFRSNDFGSTWTLTSIADKWGSSNTMDVEVSQANANIVWAGSAMVNQVGNIRSLHVSTNGGSTFTATNNYTERVMGGITKLASHPTQPHTAFATFSFAGRPKILRTTDLGQSWQDISGFGAGTSSSTGFPDVAVYCVYVRPDNPDIIWAGTEIGIVESLDNGASWTLLDDFPNVSVWDMKGVDNQVVIATHGRGIWTAELDTELVLKNPVINAMGTSPKSELAIGITLPISFDSTQVYIQGVLTGTLKKLAAGNYTLRLTGVATGIVEAKLIGYQQAAPYHSAAVAAEKIQLNDYRNQYFNYFNNATDFKLNSFSVQVFGTSNTSLQSFHNYLNDTEHTALLRQPIIISNEHPFFYYRDVALVEPGETGSTFGQPAFKDYVVVEATKDGINWTAIANGYDARANEDWLSAFNAMQVGTRTLLVDHNINLTQTLQANDTVLFRFRLSANATINGWGWSIDDLYIQQVPTGIEPPVTHNLAAYPNPTKGTINLSYTLLQASDVKVVVYDLTGKVVTQKTLGNKTAGTHEAKLEIAARPGQYILQLQTKLKNESLRIGVID